MVLCPGSPEGSGSDFNTFAAKHLKKTNTSVPSMFEGLLNIEGI